MYININICSVFKRQSSEPLFFRQLDECFEEWILWSSHLFDWHSISVAHIHIGNFFSVILSYFSLFSTLVLTCGFPIIGCLTQDLLRWLFELLERCWLQLRKLHTFEANLEVFTLFQLICRIIACSVPFQVTLRINTSKVMNR